MDMPEKVVQDLVFEISRQRLIIWNAKCDAFCYSTVFILILQLSNLSRFSKLFLCLWICFQLLYPDENENEQINLPGFLHAEDGLRLYYAIREYVDEYVRYYYVGKDDNGRYIILVANKKNKFTRNIPHHGPRKRWRISTTVQTMLEGETIISQKHQYRSLFFNNQLILHVVMPFMTIYMTSYACYVCYHQSYLVFGGYIPHWEYNISPNC